MSTQIDEDLKPRKIQNRKTLTSFSITIEDVIKYAKQLASPGVPFDQIRLVPTYDQDEDAPEIEFEWYTMETEEQAAKRVEDNNRHALDTYLSLQDRLKRKGLI